MAYLLLLDKTSDAKVGGSMRRGRDEFRRGLRSRTPLVFALAALAVVGGLAGIERFVAGGAFTVIPEARLMRIANDDYAHVSYRVAELRRHPPAVPAIYLFGGSGAIELLRSEGALSDAVTGVVGSPVEVVDLAAHSQSMGQTLAIVDNLPPGRGLLAIGVSPNRFTKSPAGDAGQLAGRPLALTSPHLAAVLRARGVNVDEKLPGLLPGVFDFAVSYVRERASATDPWFSSLPYAHHYYGDGPVAGVAAKVAGSREELAREEPLYRAYAGYNRDVLAEVARLGCERGYAVAFFEQPLGPEASGPGWDGFLARYRSDVRALALRLGVAYIDVTARAHLRMSDFADLYHLVNSGRDKWTPPFAHGLARVLVRGRVVLANGAVSVAPSLVARSPVAP